MISEPFDDLLSAFRPPVSICWPVLNPEIMAILIMSFSDLKTQPARQYLNLLPINYLNFYPSGASVAILFIMSSTALTLEEETKIMNTTMRIALFGFIYVALFVGAMATITNGVLDIAAWASMPVILTAEVLVLGMIYMTTFHGEGPEQQKAFHAGKQTAYDSQLAGQTSQKR
jgi:hypothetical protein